MVLGFGNEAQDLRGRTGTAVAAGLSLHQDELDVVLHDRVRLVGLSQEGAGAVPGFVRRVRDLSPDDRRQVVETEPAATLADGSVEGHDRVASVVAAARETHIADDADQPTARRQGAETSVPHAVELRQELFVVPEPAELSVPLRVFLERPIGRRGEDEMHGLRPQFAGLARVPQEQVVPRRNPRQQRADPRGLARLLRQSRQEPPRIRDAPPFRWQEFRQRVRTAAFDPPPGPLRRGAGSFGGSAGSVGDRGPARGRRPAVGGGGRAGGHGRSASRRARNSLSSLHSGQSAESARRRPIR